MLAMAVAVLLGASPAEGSRWSWTLDDTRTVKVTPSNSGLEIKPHRHLGKSLFELTVLAVGEQGPTRIKLVVKKGPSELVGTEWEVETNYGDLIARTTKRPPKNAKGIFTLAEATRPETLSDWSGPLSAAARVVLPDPVSSLPRAPDACSEATRSAVAEATGVMIQRVFSVNGSKSSGDASTLASTASCGPGANSWSVKFTLSAPGPETPIVHTCAGTVKTPPGASFATYDVACTADSPFTFRHRTARMRWRSTFKSTLTPLK